MTYGRAGPVADTPKRLLPPLRPSLLAALLGALLALPACGGDEEPDASGVPENEPAAVQTVPTPAQPTSTSAQRPAKARNNPPKPYAPRPGSDEENAHQSIKEVLDILERGDRRRATNAGPDRDPAIDRMVRNICRRMSRPALRQIRASATSLDDNPTTACEQSLGVHLARAARNGDLTRTAKAVITNLQIDGDKATATLKFPGEPPRQIPLIRDHDTWKLDAVPNGT